MKKNILIIALIALSFSAVASTRYVLKCKVHTHIGGYKYTYLKNCEDNADKHNRKKHSDEPDQAYCVTTYK